MNQETISARKIFGSVFVGLLLIAFSFRSVMPAKADADNSQVNSPLYLDDTETPTLTATSTLTPTNTPTPVTGLTFNGSSYGCTSGPYITCSASVTSAHTDPYRWDFDITYTYGDNRTNFGSSFTFTLEFQTGVFNTNIPIWWNMYPITNQVMPNRSIDVQYAGVSDLASMSYPNGSWTIPGQPSPYQKFWVKFSRVTTVPEILVRTDKWHLTLATYPNVATPTNTPTITPTVTLTNTPVPTATNGYTYERATALAYSDTQAHLRNTNYPLSNNTGCDCNNCTNYMSQVLHNGGYPLRVGDYDAYDGSEWWYKPFNLSDYSLTWSVTESLYYYMSLYNTEFDVNSSFGALEGGDFIMLDLRNNSDPEGDPDFIPDHGRVVVGYGTTSEEQEDYTDGCGTDLSIPAYTYTLLVNQHCVDRWHVAWNYGTLPNTTRWYLSVID